MLLRRPISTHTVTAVKWRRLA